MLSYITGSGFDIFKLVLYFISALFVIFVTQPIHEWAHALVATKLGDPTPRNNGRLTINPFAHINWIGAASILLFGFGWANPVPVNMYYFRKPKRDMAITAFAGPFSNIILAFVSLLFYNLFYYLWLYNFSVILEGVAVVFIFVANINVTLAVFNLLPIPPLDGSKILAAILPNDIYYKLMQYERYLSIILLVLVVSGALSGPISILTNGVMTGLDFVAELPFKLIFG